MKNKRGFTVYIKYISLHFDKNTKKIQQLNVNNPKDIMY